MTKYQFCHECGKSLSKNVKFCDECGVELIANGIVASNVKKVDKTSTASDKTKKHIENRSDKKLEKKFKVMGNSDEYAKEVEPVIQNEKNSFYKKPIGIIGIVIACCCIGIIFISIGLGFLIPDTMSDEDTVSLDNNNITEMDDIESKNEDISSELTYQTKVDSILTRYDYNNDGKLNDLEFAYWAVDAGMTEDDAITFAVIFSEFDSNQDGYWNQEEINNFFARND